MDLMMVQAYEGVLSKLKVIVVKVSMDMANRMEKHMLEMRILKKI